VEGEEVYRRRWWILAVLCLSVVIVQLDNLILNVALPTIQQDLGASSSELQWMVDAYTLVFAALLFTGGSLGDRFGRKLALTTGLGFFGLAQSPRTR
jgi:DHA2 family multidrug resistance protein-like MFS transporter